MYNTIMRRKDYFERVWLNPKSHNNTSSISIQVGQHEAMIEIRDCNRSVALHSGYVDSLMSSKKELNAWIRKVRLMKRLLTDMEDEVLDRWQ